MRNSMIIDVVPMHRNGEVIYTESSLRGLGVMSTTAQTNTASAVGAVSAATALLPNKPVTYQSDFSKVAYTVSAVAGVVAVIVPVGTVVAAIALIVAGVCALLGKLFAKSKAKAYKAERRQWIELNAQLRYENQELDNQYIIGSKAIQDLRAALNSMNGPSSFSLSGLGSKASREKEKLNAVKNEYDALVTEQSTKAKLLMSIVDEFNKLMKAKFDLQQKQDINKWLAWILGGSALLIGGYYAFENRHKIKKELSK